MSALASDCPHAVVSVRGVDVAKGKKNKTRLSFVIASPASGQRSELGCADDGSSSAAATVFLGEEAAAAEEMEVEVWKKNNGNGGPEKRCLGRAAFKPAECGPIRLTLDGAKTGSVWLEAKVANEGMPTAAEVIRGKMTGLLAEGMAGHFARHPKIESVLGEIVQEDNTERPEVRLAIRIEHEVLSEEEGQEGGELVPTGVAVALDGRELKAGSGGTFRAEVRDICRSVLTCKWKKSDGGGAKEGLVRKISEVSVKTAEHGFSLLGETLKEKVLGNIPGIVGGGSGSKDGNGDGQDDERTVEVAASEVPMREGTTITENGIRWKFTWEAPAQEREEEMAEGLKGLLFVLLDLQLSEMSEEERTRWDGSLSPGIGEEVEATAKLIFDAGTLEFARARALMEAHIGAPFNERVVWRAVIALSGGGGGGGGAAFKLEELNGTTFYLRHAARKMSEYDAMMRDDRWAEEQLRHCTVCLGAIRDATGADYYAETFVRYFDCVLRDAVSRRFVSLQDLEKVREGAETFAIPTADRIRGEFGEFAVGAGDLRWHDLFAQAVLDKIVPAVHNAVVFGIADPVVTFNLFRMLRGLLDYAGVSGWDERYFECFRPCLPSWTETVRAKAREQVEKVLELERDRHTGQDWRVFSEETCEEWFESAMHVGGIFKSCELTWRKLDWPDVETTTDFGITILKKLQVKKNQPFITYSLP